MDTIKKQLTYLSGIVNVEHWDCLTHYFPLIKNQVLIRPDPDEQLRVDENEMPVQPRLTIMAAGAVNFEDDED